MFSLGDLRGSRFDSTMLASTSAAHPSPSPASTLALTFFAHATCAQINHASQASATKCKRERERDESSASASRICERLRRHCTRVEGLSRQSQVMQVHEHSVQTERTKDSTTGPAPDFSFKYWASIFATIFCRTISSTSRLVRKSTKLRLHRRESFNLLAALK